MRSKLLRPTSIVATPSATAAAPPPTAIQSRYTKLVTWPSTLAMLDDDA